jgi:hypothetical protein
MHSTVQTGIYTPNIYDQHHNHYYNYNNHHAHQGRAASPGRQHNPFCHPPRLHHHHHNQHPANSNRHIANSYSNNINQHKLSVHGACSSTNISLTALDSDPNGPKLTSRLNLSTTNLNNIYSSQKNLDIIGGREKPGAINPKLNYQSHKKASIVSADPMLLSSVNNSILNMNQELNTNYNEQYRNGSMSNYSFTNNRRNTLTLGEKIRWFFDCSKPCGFLTLVLGIFLLLLSVICFLFLFHDSLCAMAETCDHPLVKMGAVCALVIGVVFVFLGLVIVVYSKKDINAKVIITSARNIGRIARKDFNQDSNVEAKLNDISTNDNPVNLNGNHNHNNKMEKELSKMSISQLSQVKIKLENETNEKNTNVK